MTLEKEETNLKYNALNSYHALDVCERTLLSIDHNMIYALCFDEALSVKKCKMKPCLKTNYTIEVGFYLFLFFLHVFIFIHMYFNTIMD